MKGKENRKNKDTETLRIQNRTIKNMHDNTKNEQK